MSTSDQRSAALNIAEAITEAFARRDIDGFMQAYAPDIAVWHNFDRQTQNSAENRTLLDGFMSLFASLQYTDICRVHTDEGIVQHHLVVGVLPDGRRLEMPACLILTIQDERIVRIDEYSDPAPFFALMAEST